MATLSFFHAQPRRQLITILICAMAFRMIWAAFVPVVPISDSVMYDLFAREIAAGNGYRLPNGEPTVFWAVGASAIYGAVYSAIGAGSLAVVLVNVVLGLVFIAATYWLAFVRFGTRIAVIASSAIAVWPIWIQFTTVLNSELPFACLLTLSMAMHSDKSRPTIVRTSLAAVLLVGAIYMRPIALPLAFLMPLLGWIDHRSARRAIVETVLSCLIVAALLLPWAMRNQAQFGQPVLVSANFGSNLWMGNNPMSQGGYMELPPMPMHDEVERDAELKSRALTFIRDNPGQFLTLSLKRVALTFDRESIGVVWNEGGLPKATIFPLKVISLLYWYGILALAAIGIVLWIRKDLKRLFDPLIAAVGLFTAIGILVVGNDRYHMPLAPFMAIFAAIAYQRLWLRFVGRRARTGLNYLA